MNGTTTRKLVRQEWRPLAGRRIVRFVAMPGSNTVPAMEWTDDDLPGNSKIHNEVIGFAEIKSGRHFPTVEERSEFEEKIEEEAEWVTWHDRSEAPQKAAETEESEEDQDPAEDEETDPDPESDPDNDVEEEEKTPAPTECGQCGFTHVDAACWDDDSILCVDGWVEYDANDEPYQIHPEASTDQVQEGVHYQAIIDGIQNYGVFVNLTPELGREEKISGLVHQANLGLQTPSDFEYGETVTVKVESKERDEIGFYLIETESGNDSLLPGGDWDD